MTLIIAVLVYDNIAYLHSSCAFDNLASLYGYLINNEIANLKSLSSNYLIHFEHGIVVIVTINAPTIATDKTLLEVVTR